MYKLKKKIVIAVAHNLNLKGDNKCNRIHGHNLRVTVYCKSKALNKEGVIIDLGQIKKIVMQYDHQYLNDLLPFSPTIENLAKHFCESIPFCYKVKIKETPSNICVYERDV